MRTTDTKTDNEGAKAPIIETKPTKEDVLNRIFENDPFKIL